jgi:hypothetical protein
MILCSAYTPSLIEPDAAEVSVPFDPIDGISSIDWNVKRISLRVQTPETVTSSIDIEKSSGPGVFSATTVGSLMLLSGSYETAFASASLGTVTSGDKLRFNVTALGTAANWTIITEISNA